MMTTNGTEDKLVGISIPLTERTLMRLTDDIIVNMGKTYVAALKRKRDELLCERDGHVAEGQRYEMAGICDRCSTVIDRERYEATKAG